MSDVKKQKKTFLSIFSLLTLLLVILPFLVVFNEGLTRFAAATPIYRLIQATIVPYEVKIVAAVLYLMHIPATYQIDGLNINGAFLRVTWNCLGWQSMIFLLITFAVGLQGAYRTGSVLETAIIGILGTFLMNILRICAVVLLGAYFPSVFVVVFHDYLAAILTIIWLFFFWWFVYSYVLEERRV